MADDNNWSLTDSPYVYIIFPIIIFLILGLALTILLHRRHRRRSANGRWPQDQTGAPGETARRTGGNGTGSRWTPWRTNRADEGLNELGEAPPPYKRQDSSDLADTEMRDLEAGTERPPEYPAEPEPVATGTRQGLVRNS